MKLNNRNMQHSAGSSVASAPQYQWLAIVIMVVVLIYSSICSNQVRLVGKQRHTANAPTKYLNGGTVPIVDVFSLPLVNPDSLLIMLYYSVPYEEMIFQKTSVLGTNDNQWFATPVVESTFKDSNGIIRKRFISNDTVLAKTYDQTQSNTQYYTNFVTFSLPKSNYKVASKLDNPKSAYIPAIETSINENHLTPVFLQQWRDSQPSKSSSQTNALDSSFWHFIHKRALVTSNFVSWSEPEFVVLIPLCNGKLLTGDQASASDSEKFTYNISKNSNNSLYNWGDFNNISGDFASLATNNSNFVKLIVPMDTFAPGKYTLTIHKQAFSQDSNLKSDTSFEKKRTPIDNKAQARHSLTEQAQLTASVSDNIEFEVRWLGMPRSLIDPAFAVEQMHLILTDEEYKEMKSADKPEIFTKIIEHWKYSDPTPATQYNEAMTEFFRRVDIAEESFKTLTQKEGAKSDRGKVFILNGKPDKVDNQIKDNVSFEIWHYNKLKTSYVFEILSVGNYKLTSKEAHSDR